MTSVVDSIVDQFLINAVGSEESKQKGEIVTAFITDRKAITAQNVSNSIVFGSKAVTTVSSALEDAKARLNAGAGSDDEVEAQASLLKALTGAFTQLKV